MESFSCEITDLLAGITLLLCLLTILAGMYLIQGDIGWDIRDLPERGFRTFLVAAPLGGVALVAWLAIAFGGPDCDVDTPKIV